jgi:seryl-tRNA synthetase
MLQVSYIKDNFANVVSNLGKRNIDFTKQLQEVIELDDSRKKIQSEYDSILNESNKIAKDIGILFKSGKGKEAENLKLKSISLKPKSKNLHDELHRISEDLKAKLCLIPNVPHDLVVKGLNEEENEIIFSTKIPEKEEILIPHWELSSKLDIIDFDLGNKITGSGFPVYKNKGAKLQRSLINFFLDKNISKGYNEIQPPLLVNEVSGFSTGQLPDKEGQMYHVQNDNLYLIPTAEVPLTNIYRNSILKIDELPIKLTGYTPCFRREAGSYGSDVRGLNRLHQFDKVEIVRIECPSKSYQVLDEMVEHIKSLLLDLELPFRIIRLCGGDLGFTSALTYDFEVYSMAQKKWLEVSSVSNFESFQANRLKVRVNYGDKSKKLVHTLNGSSLALPRVVAALIENNQTNEGIKIPKILHNYTGFKIID